MIEELFLKATLKHHNKVWLLGGKIYRDDIWLKTAT